MIRKIIHRLLERRYHWRTVGFSELAELYANRLLRLMAVNMVSGVVSIYMYQLGYPVWFIFGFFAAYFFARAVLSIPAGYFIARVGPKHGSLVSNFLGVPALLALTQLENAGIYALVTFGLLQSFAVSLYVISYHVNFSKVKHAEHAGKELSFMYILEKIGTGLSPLVGGLVAYLFGPEATMVAASILFIVSAGPLFLTPEPVMTRQHIIFRGFNWRATWRSLVSAAAIGVDQLSSAATWSLFVAIAVFGTTSNVVYAQIGGLMSIAFLASLAFSRLYGVIIDRRRGGELLRASVVGDFLLDLARPFASTPLGVVLINVFNEALTSGYSMPYLKGQYDMADSLSGYRIVYMTLIEVSLCLGATVFGVIGMLLVMSFGDIRGIQLSYIVAALGVLPILMHGFPALRRAQITNR
jgi:MFS family permease